MRLEAVVSILLRIVWKALLVLAFAAAGPLVFRVLGFGVLVWILYWF